MIYLLVTAFLLGIGVGAFVAASLALFLSPLIGQRRRAVVIAAGLFAPIVAAGLTVHAIVTLGGPAPNDIKPIVVWGMLALAPGALIGSFGAALLSVRLLARAARGAPTPPP